MNQPDLEAARAPLASLSTKIIVFVFLSTLATTLLVSWISIQSTYNHLSQALDVEYPAALRRAGADVEDWLAKRDSDRAPSEKERKRLVALLAPERPSPLSRLMVVSREGEVLAAAVPAGTSAPERTPLEPLLAPGATQTRDYADADGLRAVGAARPLANGTWLLVVEAPFDHAFSPVLTAVTRIFVLDLCIILLFSFLAYRITSGAMRPIEELSDAARRIASGDFDHEVAEPDAQDEVGLLARTFNDMMRRLRGYQSEIEAANTSLMERNVELQQAKETFEQLSITDGLTKLHNHRFFQDHLTREIKRVTRTGEPLSMLLVDIDDFKQLNDRFGHAAGDELLMGMARIMNEMVRDSDLLARYGGEEFVVLTADTDLEGAYKLAEKIRTSIAETSFILDDSLRPTRITVSVGVAQFGGNRKEFFQT
ncbi:MAG: GGDEF domain-containing protein, partial [Myxococcota bacterium]